MWHGIFPGIAVVIMGYGIYASLHPLPAYPQNFMPFFVLGWILVGVLWMLYLRARDPAKLQLIGRIIFLDTDRPATVSVAAGAAGEPPPAGPGEVDRSPG